MPTTNRERFQRAVNTADQLSAGGLKEEKQQYFAETTLDETGLRQAGARVEVLMGGTYEIPKLTMSNRVLIPRAYGDNQKLHRRVTPSNIKLNPVDVVVPVQLQDKMLRDAVGSSEEATADQIIEMFAKQAANNLEMLVWEGDTLGPAIAESDMVDGGSSSIHMLDVTLQLLDGIFKQAESGRSVNAANADFSDEWINKALIELPDKWQRNPDMLRMFMSTAHHHRFKKILASRATNVGDDALAGRVLKPYGVQLAPLSLFPRNPTKVEHLAANTDGTTATSLAYSPISSLVLTPTTLDINGTTKYVLATDYSESESAGTWTRLGGDIGSGATIKSTYKTRGRAILTDPSNIVLGMVRDSIKILKGQNIYTDVHEYAIHMSVDVKILDTDAVVVINNLANPA